MYFNGDEAIAQQRIAGLRADAETRRRLRARPVRPRHRRDSMDRVREALGYRLVVLGWRLLDANPGLARRQAVR